MHRMMRLQRGRVGEPYELVVMAGNRRFSGGRLTRLLNCTADSASHPWRCDGVRIATSHHVSGHKPNRMQRRNVELLSLFSERAQMRLGSHALLVSFGVDEA
jgi:hypothetical protein